MADTTKIGTYNVDNIKIGTSSVTAVYLGTNLVWSGGTTPPTPPTVTYAVVDDISQYTATTYIDVYDMATDLWYKKNNNNTYEQYGVYGTSTGASETYYEGKLAIVDGYEYKYSGNSWVNVGEVSGGSTSYPINDSNISDYVGMEMPTTFKIPVEDVDALGGWLDFRIQTSDGGDLEIGTDQYYYMGNDWEEGTVTNDGTYYNYSLPNTQSITIQRINYWDSNTIHIIISSLAYPIYYIDTLQPDFFVIYDTVSDMEDETDIYVGKYGKVGNTIYKYDETSGWTLTADKLMTGTTVSNIRSSQLYFGAYNSGVEKFYVNGNQTDGVHNWVFHNENPFSAISFNTNVTDAGLVSFDFLTLDTSQYTTVTGNIVYGNMPSIKEVNIPPSVTSITDSCIGVYGSNCPLRINMLMASDLTTCYNYWDGGVDRHVYIPNGIILGQWTPITNTASKMTIHVPSSAVTRYRNDAYAKTYIPFIELTDNGTADLSYSYYYRNYQNGHTYAINYTDTVITGSSLTNNDGWSSLYFGSNITSIANNAFRNTDTKKCIPRIVNLRFENGLTSIGDYAFYRGNVTNIWDMPNYEFINCEKYGYIEIPDSVTTIGQYAFYRGYTSYVQYKERIVIGSGITSIGDYAFYTAEKFLNVDNEITCKATTPPALGTNAFYNGTTTYITAIYVPSESVNAYKSASGWSNYANIIQAIPNS